MDVVIHNPCYDSGLIGIIPGLVPDFTYVVGIEMCWQHEDFIIDATPSMIDICGELVYSLNVNVYVDIFIYYEDTHTICINTDDTTLIDINIDISINVSFNNYFDCTVCINCCGTGGGVVIIVDPCD